MKYISKEDVVCLENKGDILACKYYHKFLHPYGVEAIGDCNSENVDDKKWDVFHIQFETKDAYYGSPMLGMGLMDCMIIKEDTRGFLESELNYNLGMIGSHYGTELKKFNIRIEPIVNKL